MAVTSGQEADRRDGEAELAEIKTAAAAGGTTWRLILKQYSYLVQFKVLYLYEWQDDIKAVKQYETNSHKFK